MRSKILTNELAHIKVTENISKKFNIIDKFKQSSDTSLLNWLWRS